MMKNQKINPAQILLFIFLIALGAIIFNTEAKPSEKKSDYFSSIKYRYQWKVKPENTEPNDHRLGRANARIEIVEFSDTECPYCKVFHETMHKLIDHYDGEIAWVYKHLPLGSLHQYAYNEALATECVEEFGGNIAFWQYIDAIFKETKSNDGLPPSMLLEIAKAIGIDENDFTNCMQNPDMRNEIDSNIAEVKSIEEKLGTPFSVIKKDGIIVEKVSGSASLSAMIEKIDALLKD